MNGNTSLLAELKRRHVWRVAAAYAVTAWLLLQLADIVLPAFGAPDWTMMALVVLFAIGFVVAVVFAWVFEVTPEGIRRTAAAGSPDARTAPAHRAVGHKLNTVILVVLVLAVAVLGWRLYAVKHRPATSPASAAALRSPVRTESVAPRQAGVASTAGIPEKSVAVLPFVNDSGDKDQQYFSDGLSQDLITALTQFAGLKVISRDSAFQFRSSKDTAAQIGQLLGVAHLLEGSVQRAGDEVRITATLVNAADGSVLWTQRYDKPYKDLFALQDDITQSVATALKAKLLTTPGAVVQSARPPSGNLDAYTAYQQGVAYSALATEAGVRKAIEAFGEAARLDPHYAAAYAQLCNQWLDLRVFGGADTGRIAAKARAASATALELDPDSALAHGARAALLMKMDMDWVGAKAEFRRALQLAPNDAEARSDLANILATLGQNQQAVKLTRQALASDPRRAIWYSNLGVSLTALGQLDQAVRAFDTSIALQSGAVDVREGLAVVEILRGNARAALAAARKEPPGPWHDIAMTLALQVGSNRKSADAALEKLIAQLAGEGAYQIAEVYALRGDADNTFKWLDRAWTNRDPGISQLLYDPLILRYRNDPRFAAFCRKVGLPTTTDAVAMR